MSERDRRGVLLMTYGSPASLEREDVKAYLARVRRGREPDAELVDEFTRRYRVIGGSPLIEITRAQAAALEAVLGWPVEVGMRFSDPSIAAGLAALAERDVSDVTAIVLSPQYSPILMNGYAAAIAEALPRLGQAAPQVVVAGPGTTSRRSSRRSRRRDPRGARQAVRRRASAGPGPPDRPQPAAPRRRAKDPAYLAQLRETAEAVAGLPAWPRSAGRSAGRAPATSRASG